MSDQTRIELEDGKYTLVREDGNLYALRYGDSWRDFTGDKLIGAMFDEIVELRAKAPPPDVVEAATSMKREGYRGPLAWAQKVIDWVAAQEAS